MAAAFAPSATAAGAIGPVPTAAPDVLAPAGRNKDSRPRPNARRSIGRAPTFSGAAGPDLSAPACSATAVLSAAIANPSPRNELIPRNKAARCQPHFARSHTLSSRAKSRDLTLAESPTAAGPPQNCHSDARAQRASRNLPGHKSQLSSAFANDQRATSNDYRPTAVFLIYIDIRQYRRPS